MADITLLTYGKVARKYKGYLFVMMTISVVIVASITMITPRTYTARVSTFPPAPEQTLKGAPVLGISVGGGTPTSVTSLSYLLKTRRMAEGVVDHFDLTQRYGATREAVLRKVPLMISGHDVSQGTLFMVQATTEDPDFSAALANFCVDHLNVINEQLGLTAEKPMLKVIDRALPPQGPNPRHTLKKVLSALLASGVGGYFFFFFLDYFRTVWKEEERRKTVTADAEEILTESK